MSEITIRKKYKLTPALIEQLHYKLGDKDKIVEELKSINEQYNLGHEFWPCFLYFSSLTRIDRVKSDIDIMVSRERNL